MTTAAWTTAAIVAAGLAIVSSLHAIAYKRDVRAAIGWAGFIWVAPLAGPLFYLLFGVNRIRRRGAALRGQKSTGVSFRSSSLTTEAPSRLIQLGDAVSRFPLRSGNRINHFEGGADVFPEMTRAIDDARTSVTLCTYILGNDGAGRRFVDALTRASRRGVAVRVLVDAVGTRSGRGRLLRELSRSGVRAAAFLPALGTRGLLNTNLRNHRKLLVVDGRLAFTGGINLSDAYETPSTDPGAIRDTHFVIDGPLVRDLQQTFAEDWAFVSGERLVGPEWFPSLDTRGSLDARAVADGPDEDFERIRWIILGAIASARTSIRVVTPYFLPDAALIAALSVAALRGVSVEIVVPERPDHMVVKWASDALLWQVLERGCRVWVTSRPFDHSKLLTVDGSWTFFGSANWDPRSFRLNFELNVEVFGAPLAGPIDAMIDRRIADGREVTLALMDARRFPVRVRDGLARLLTPYL
ncbi:MAG: phospholipase D-like domain-containing protein [Thermoanaerobaculia bacterium]|nr:phospholipase D-like domain-containing protein [Thermoanaerobaculia bacterium]